MSDTFLGRLGYVLDPTVGDPKSLADRAGTLVSWLVTVWFNGTNGGPIPTPPAWLTQVFPQLPALLVLFTMLLTGYHMMHPDTTTALQPPQKATKPPASGGTPASAPAPQP